MNNAFLGPFQLIEPLSSGGMGEVWRGRHVEQEVTVAIKVITASTAREPEAVLDFRNEVAAMASLNDPRIIYIFDYGEASEAVQQATAGRVVAGSPYLVMEFADRGALSDLASPLSWVELKPMLVAILDGLAHAHARGVIHRDLKPPNVLFCGPEARRPGLKLSDFGIAHPMQGTGGTSKLGRMMGTKHYMAPEQVICAWRDYGPWTDLYALGCMTYQLLTGAPPFAHRKGLAAMKAHVQEAPPPLKPSSPVPSGLTDWLAGLLSKQPHQRFQCAADAKHVLLGLGDPGQPPANHPTWSLAPTTQICRVDAPIPGTWREALSPPPPRQLVGVGLSLFELRPVPMIGREAERDALWRTLVRTAHTGQPQCVVIEGSSGRGVSALVQWFVERAHELGAAQPIRVMCPTSEHAEAALQAALVHVVGAARLAEPEREARIGDFLDVRGGDETEKNALKRLLTEPPGRLPTAERHAQIMQLLSRMAQFRPVILWLDGVHHQGLDGLALADMLVRTGPPSSPIVLVVTAYPEAIADGSPTSLALQTLQDHPGAHAMRLGPLPEAQQGALIRGLISLETSLAADVQERTGGYSQFAVQVIGEWIRQDLLELGPHGFRLREGASPDISSSSYGIWSTRIKKELANHPETMLASLELAAVLGLEVNDGEWHNACDMPSDTFAGRGRHRRAAYDRDALQARMALLTTMLDHRFITETETGWAFSQPMIRESLLRMAKEAGRWQLHHAACANMLAATIERAPAGVWERLGRHLASAGAQADALEALNKGILEREASGQLLNAIGLLAEYERTLQALSVPLSDTRWAAVYTRRARLLWQVGQRAESTHWSQQGTLAGYASGWRAAKRHRLTLEVGWALDDLDLDHASRQLNMLRNILKTKSNPLFLGKWFVLAGHLARAKRKFDDAMVMYGRAKTCFKELNKPHSALRCTLFMATVELIDADVDRAESFVDKAEPDLTQLGARQDVARCHLLRSAIHRHRGDHATAVRFAQDALATLEVGGSRVALEALYELGLVALAARDYSQAHRWLQRARGESERARWLVLETGVKVALLPCLAEARHWEILDAAMHALEPQLDNESLLSLDTAWPMATAAELAARGGAFQLSERLTQLATRVAKHLGITGPLGQLQQGMVGLGDEA